MLIWVCAVTLAGTNPDTHKAIRSGSREMPVRLVGMVAGETQVEPLRQLHRAAAELEQPQGAQVHSGHPEPNQPPAQRAQQQ